MEIMQYVGMDVHKDQIEIAVFSKEGRTAELVTKTPNQESSLRKFFAKLQERGEVIAGYEAGCLGFDLFRTLESIGVLCVVIAPSKIARKPGDKVKTDRKDAILLAKVLRTGDYQPIYVPSRKDEQVREFLRAREDRKSDLTKTKQRLLKFFLRNGYRYEGKKNWTQKHRKWMQQIEFVSPLQESTYQLYHTTLVSQEQQLARIDERVREIAMNPEYTERVGVLRCFKGIDFLTALSFVVEISDYRRFMSAEAFMGFLGMTPKEHSSGTRRNQGGITKAGNSHLRKLLIESSWHYRYKSMPSKTLEARRTGQSEAIVAYAEKARIRLQYKFGKMIYQGKPKQLVVTGVARELSGFIWGAMTAHIA